MKAKCPAQRREIVGPAATAAGGLRRNRIRLMTGAGAAPVRQV